LSETDFRLFAVSVRYPQGLARQVSLVPVQPGVYEVQHFMGQLRLVVVHELPQQEHNALLHLFSARMDLLQYGATHYHLRSKETSTLLLQLFERYRLEEILMPDLLEQFAQETIQEIVKKLSIEERLKGLSAQEIIKNLPAEERLKGLSAQEIVRNLPAAERLKDLSVDDLLAALSPETRAALALRLKEVAPFPKPEPREPEQKTGGQSS
jgi:hypothetical protein